MSPSQAHSTAELELAHRARSGDREALAQLYQRHAPALYRHAVRMLGDQAAAHDAVQEAFSKALGAIGRTRQELKFKAWIFRIVTNLCLRRLTRRQRFHHVELGHERQDQASHGPEQDLRRAEAGQRVMQALDQLPPQYRQMLVLRELDELSYEELAEALESDVSRVRVTLHRARARLAALFIARELVEDPGARVDCPELQPLLEPPPRQAPLVKHLESCPHCRQRRHRPAAELLALLPPVEPPELNFPVGELVTSWTRSRCHEKLFQR